MNRRLGWAAIAVGLITGWPAAPLDAASPHVFRFQAQWVINPDGICGTPHSTLFLTIPAADVNVVSFTYQFTPDPCTTNLEIISGGGLVDVRGNLTRLEVDGTIPADGDRQVTIDLTLRKTGNLPDPGPGEKAVSASARGEVILDGTDLTGGQPSTSAQITRSKS
jgi:hypothetical protein